MIRIAICEDNEIERRILQNLVDAFFKERGTEALFHEFSSGEELISTYQEKRYDIVFLDVLMKKIDGIETGKIIRGIDKKTEIIYCTFSSDFAAAAYEVHAMGYLLKPYEPDRIGALLDHYLRRGQAESE